MERKRLNPWYIFIALLILPSPIFHAYGISYQMRAMIVLVFDFFLLIKNRFQIPLHFLRYLSLLLIMGVITAIGNKGIEFIFLLYCLIFYSLLINLSTEDDISKFVDIASIFLIILEIGAYIAFVYFILGGKSLWSFPNPDGRQNDLWLTTFTNAWVSFYIRPAGIYDEPGSFAFFIICICILRIKYKKNPKITLFILLLGYITTSLAYIICSFFVYLELRKKFSYKYKQILCLLLVLLIFALLSCCYNVLNTMIFSRFIIDPTTHIMKGDNRSSQITNAIQYIKDYGFLFGYHHHIDNSIITSKYGIITENIFTPITKYGFFNSLPFTLLYLFGIFLLPSDSRYIVISILLLFMQRPYYEALGYTGFFSIFFNMFYKSFIKKYSHLFILRR